MDEITVVSTVEILGREIKFYRSVEEPLFLAKDVAEWIDNKNHRDLLTRVDDDEKAVGLTDTPGGKQNTWFLTEDGLYEVLMQSRKPDAKPLKKKIKNHLKKIRLSGGSVEEGREEEFINKYFPSFSDEVKRAMVLDLHKKNQELNRKLEEAQPKITAYDYMIDSENLIGVTAFGKHFGLSQKKIFEALKNTKMLYRQFGCYYPYEGYYRDCFELKRSVAPNGHTYVSSKIKPSGVEKIVRKLIKEGYIKPKDQ